MCVCVYIYIYIVYLGSKLLSKHIQLKTTNFFHFQNLQVKTQESSCYFSYIWVKMVKKVPHSSPFHWSSSKDVLGCLVL